MKARCRSCYWLNWDFISGEYVSGQWFCGLHGGTCVDPDGEQRDLNHHGGCGYVFASGMRQLRIF